jgi:membrane-associated protease RseP (regulator of RpoE activity)
VDRLLHRYFPLVELLAVFSVIIASRAADYVPADRRVPSPSLLRPSPSVEKAPPRLDAKRLSGLTGLSMPDSKNRDDEPSCSISPYVCRERTRIAPAFVDGVAVGLKLFSIRPDSMYAKAGIENGDIVTRINGYDMSSPEKALDAYSAVKDACTLDIEVVRNGKTVHLRPPKSGCGPM